MTHNLCIQWLIGASWWPDGLSWSSRISDLNSWPSRWEDLNALTFSHMPGPARSKCYRKVTNQKINRDCLGTMNRAYANLEKNYIWLKFLTKYASFTALSEADHGNIFIHPFSCSHVSWPCRNSPTATRVSQSAPNQRYVSKIGHKLSPRSKLFDLRPF